MRRRADSAREVLRRHPWAIALLQSRLNPGPATLRHHNAFIGTLRAGGLLACELTAHAFALIDSYVYGFALSEAALPIHGPESVAETAVSMMEQFFDAGRLPAPARVHDASTSCSPATTSAWSSATGST